MIAAGMLNRKISIKRLVLTRDASGGYEETWAVLYANIPASLKELTGREKFFVEGSREISYDQKMFTIRYIAGLTAKDAVLYNGEIYDILRMHEVGLREGLCLTVQLAK